MYILGHGGGRGWGGGVFVGGKGGGAVKRNLDPPPQS